MKSLDRNLIAVATLALFLGCGIAAAADWPEWRGPGRDGVVESFDLPGAWPSELHRLWQVEVGSGHASPVVVGGRVYVQARRGDDEVLWCLDLATGKVRWSKAHPVAYAVNRAAAGHGPGPKSTPAVAGGRVFALSIAGDLSCYDAASGELLWHRGFRDRFPATAPHFGTATSPLVDGDRVIAFVGGHDKGALIAFDVETGDELWSWTGDGPGYASPVIAEIGGARQLVTQSQKELVGLDPSTGKLLWSRAFETIYVQNIVTPLVHGDTLIFSGIEKGVTALRPVKGESGWKLDEVWHTDAVSMYMNSPVLAGDCVCGFSNTKKGQFFCLDASSGATRWLSEGRLGSNAATLVADGVLLHLTDDAELRVVRACGDKYAPLATYTVAGSPTWAHPAPVEGGVLIKDASSVARWSFAPPPTKGQPR
jgi:outer membrane protein assembly factor BamB